MFPSKIVSGTAEPKDARAKRFRAGNVWPWFLIIACTMATLPSAAGAAECEVTLDLSRGDLGFDASIAGTVSCVQLINAIPAATYEVELGRVSCIAPLSTSAFSFSGSGLPSSERLAQDACGTATSELTSALGQAKSESDVEKAVDAYKAKSLTGCTSGDNAVASTRKQDGTSLVLGADETLTVSVKRAKAISLDEKTWKIPSSCSGWQTTYGFTFVPNRDRKFVSKVGEEEGTFVITEEEDREEGDFLASILFRYSRPGKNFGPIFGLGYDLENISVLGGIGYTFNENVTVTGGIAIHERTDLVGRYNAGDVIKENIDSDQLVEKTFVPNLYIGLSFRFGSNIFRQRDAARADAAKAAAAAAKKAKDDAKTEAEEAEAKRLKEELTEATEKKCKLEAEQTFFVAEETCLTTRITDDRACNAGEETVKASCLEIAKTKAQSCIKKAEAAKKVAEAECEELSARTAAGDGGGGDGGGGDGGGGGGGGGGDGGDGTTT